MNDNPDTAATRRLMVLFAVCCAAAAMPTTFTGPAVALPAIGRSLGGSPVELTWVTNAFMLTFGSLLMATGALADGIGRKRIFLGGLVAFILTSGELALAGDIFWLDVMRALQGAAAAAAFSGGMASLAQEFDGPSRMRAFSLVGASFGVGLAFGPMAAGLMIETFGWRSIFVLVVALGLIALVVGTLCMEESRDPEARGHDLPGVVSFSLALTLLTFGVLQAPESGWSDPIVIGMLVGAIVLFVAFWRIERRMARPMLDLTLFRYPRFVGVQLLAAAPAYGFVVLLVLLPVRFIGVAGMDAITGGQLMIALSGPLLVLPIAAGMLTRWLAPATICGLGLAVVAVGLFWLSHFPLDANPVRLAAPLLTIGIGISLPWGLMDGLAVSVVPKERAGMATGIFSTTRVAGEGVALAIVTALLSALTASGLKRDAGAHAAAIAQQLVTGNPSAAVALMPSVSREVFVGAYSHAFGTLLLVLTAITAATAIVVFIFLGRGSAEIEETGADFPAAAECSEAG